MWEIHNLLLHEIFIINLSYIYNYGFVNHLYYTIILDCMCKNE